MSDVAVTHELGNGKDWKLTVNERRVLIQSRCKVGGGWTVLSSAVLNGGLQSFPPSHSIQILNAKVPADYDGIDPDPRELLRLLAKTECDGLGNDDDHHRDQSDDTSSIGLLTAASMETVRISSQKATGTCQQTCIVDVIVTAGISNARAAGADADIFYFVPTPRSNIGTSNSSMEVQPTKVGTINTIILVNLALDNTSALMEAYTVAIEAKCRALTDLGIPCAKHPNQVATGTGTDSTVIVSRTSSEKAIPYAQKHTLLGELIGQAVYQATKESIESNLTKVYESYPSPVFVHRLRSYQLQLVQALHEGHRPLVPSQPMKPIPSPSGWVLWVGFLGVAVAMGIHLYQLPDVTLEQCRSPENIYLTLMQDMPPPSMSALFAVLCADRFLGSVVMPLAIHPVVLVGKIISFGISVIPKPFFQSSHPMLGFLSGCLLLGMTLIVSVGAAWFVMILPRIVFQMTRQGRRNYGSDEKGTCDINLELYVAAAAEWAFHVFLVRGSLSLQLLCNVGLQMAHFLERGQLDKARNQLSWLCSRDPSDLRPDELAGATLESLSENLSDSVISPLFFYILAGPFGAFAFRIVNTLDSRVGYRGKYEWVGKPAARLDDLLNLVPARFTSLLLVFAAAPILKHDSRGAGRTSVVQHGLVAAWRDAGQCDSPNAGWPMATMAGVLGVRLDKRGHYSLNGPKNGGNGKSPNHLDIRMGHTVVLLAGVLGFLLAMALCPFIHHNLYSN